MHELSVIYNVYVWSRYMIIYDIQRHRYMEHVEVLLPPQKCSGPPPVFPPPSSQLSISQCVSLEGLSACKKWDTPCF